MFDLDIRLLVKTSLNGHLFVLWECHVLFSISTTASVPLLMIITST